MSTPNAYRARYSRSSQAARFSIPGPRSAACTGTRCRQIPSSCCRARRALSRSTRCAPSSPHQGLHHALAKNAVAVQQQSLARFTDANQKAVGVMGQAITQAWLGPGSRRNKTWWPGRRLARRPSSPPQWPACLSSTRILAMTIPRSTALHMASFIKMPPSFTEHSGFSTKIQVDQRTLYDSS